MVFFKTLKMVHFSTSKRKKWSFFLYNYSTHTIFSWIFEIFFSISDFFQKFSKIFGLEFWKISKFSSHQNTILRLILENGLFLWNHGGFTVVSNLIFWNHLWVKVVSSDFGGFFFLGKVSRSKKDHILAKIHHMLGFTETVIKKWAVSP